MRRTQAARMAVLITALLWPSHAAAETAGAPVVVLFEPATADLPQDEIREGIARELHRPVRSTPEPDLATLTVARTTSGDITVRYHPPASELERKVALPTHAEQVPMLVALIAKNLVSNEARELMAELATRKAAGAAAPGAPEAVPGPRFHFRFSLGGGYTTGMYVTNTAGTPSTRGAAYDVGVSGGEVGLHIAIGTMRSSGLAFGVEASAGLSFLEQHGSLGRTALRGALPLQLGGFVDYYPQARGPFHLQGGLAGAYTRFAYSVAEANSSGLDSSVHVKPLFGAMTYIGAGYDFGSRGIGGFGLFARSQFGFFVDGYTNFVPLGFQLGVSVASP